MFSHCKIIYNVLAAFYSDGRSRLGVDSYVEEVFDLGVINYVLKMAS